MATLEIKDLHVSVNTEEGAKEILKGVDLTIKSGETHAIMGPNGSGKSTLTHTIAVQVPADDIPQAFEVDLTGLEINYSRHLSDITLPENVKVIEHGDITLVTIVPPSGYAEEMKAAAGAAAAD